MTGIAGAISQIDGHSGRICRALLEQQSQFGRDDRSLGRLDDAVFGRNLFKLLPEDAFDRQPVVLCGGRAMLVGDLRLDNRSELIAALGIASANAGKLADSDLLGRAYERWRLRLFDHIVGDYAFAIWDGTTRQLILARDPLGQRPLHYRIADNHVGFASMPAALASAAHRIDATLVTEFLLDRPRIGDASYFADVRRVEPASCVVIENRNVSKRDYWFPGRTVLKLRRPEDYVAAFNEHFDAAVASRLRGMDGAVATHLSAGLDSSAVTAAAARLTAAAGGRVLALTAAPGPGFTGRAPPGRIADESPAAAQTAALYANLDHLIIRPNPSAPLRRLDRDAAFFQEPTGDMSNGIWWSAVNDAVRQRGITILLTGEMGNLSISAGGYGALADMLRQGGVAQWLREVRTITKARRLSPAKALAHSLGGLIPRPLWQALNRRFGQPVPDLPRFARHVPGADARTRASVPRGTNQPAWNGPALRLELLRSLDLGNFKKGMLGIWGVDERDPTSDRRLIEFCLSLPADQFLKDGVSRPLLRAALRGAIPEQIFDASERGFQAADWYEHFATADLADVMAAAQACPDAAALVDLPRLQALVDAWPDRDWDQVATIRTYRLGVLRAVAGATFVRHYACANPAPESIQSAG